MNAVRFDREAAKDNQLKGTKLLLDEYYAAKKLFQMSVDELAEHGFLSGVENLKFKDHAERIMKEIEFCFLTEPRFYATRKKDIKTYYYMKKLYCHIFYLGCHLYVRAGSDAETYATGLGIHFLQHHPL